MDSVITTPSQKPFQVPSVGHVLHRLKDVPEANFYSMVWEVSACPGLPAFSPACLGTEK